MSYVRLLFVSVLFISLRLEAADSIAFHLVERVITNQESVNLVYDAETVILFYSMDGELKTRRNLVSRYYVHGGRIIKGERIRTEVSYESSGDFPRYREGKILPLFSPLSWEALPFYEFEYVCEEIRNGFETVKIRYSPRRRSRELSYGHVWVSKRDTDLVSLEMIASIPFAFTEYFIMNMEYVRLDSIWVPDVIDVELEINLFGIYRRHVIFKQNVVRRYF